MPTFLILKGSSVKETIRGANPTALRTAVLSAAADAAKGPTKATASFSGTGQTLGSAGGGGAPARSGISAPSVDFAAMVSSPAAFAQGRGFPHLLVRFLGLYFTTLFSFDPIESAEHSPFSVKNTRGNRVR